MKDRIIATYLKDFVEQFGLTYLDDNEAFEHFVNYCIVSKLHPEPFEPDEIASGGAGDLGLDGLGILVNEHLVSSIEDVDYLKKTLRRLDVQFVLIQSKYSPRIETSDIGTMMSGARRFFDESLPPEANDRVRELHEIKEHIFDSSIDMDRSPNCNLYYATTGTWRGDGPLQTRVDQGRKDLTDTGLFSSVEFVPLDSEGLKRLYREVHHKVEREIVFDKHTILPQIAGVEEAYIGIVPSTEYVKLICDDDASLNRRLFYDNVRDFQGHNQVNQEMDATIRDAASSDRFALLNNGITVVARDVNKVGTRFRLRDYQIVNGCQTSHILYLNRDRLSENIFVPLKLIVTVDPEVTNQIIQGTNRQTEVKLEAFESLAPFQKRLEELYLALGRAREEPIYYERRSKQYEHLDVRKDRIISLATQIKCFVAMFLNEPHSTHRYYGELLNAYRPRLFQDSQSAVPYYLSGVALASMERLFSQERLPRTWRPVKYQMLMVYRLQNEPGPLPALHSKAIEGYCDAMLKQLEDVRSYEGAFRRAGEVVEEVLERLRPWREAPARTRAFTTALVGEVVGEREEPATASYTGTVKWFSDIKGYGFIASDAHDRDIFVHHSSILGVGWKTLLQDQGVRFSIVETDRGPQAVDVEVTPDLVA
jgi:cold shock CspA family protein